MQQVFEIYRHKQTEFCVGCLHITEDVTELTNSFHNYAFIFNTFFSNIYKPEECNQLWICSWCTQKIKNTQKLLNNFECAKNILTAIKNNSDSGCLEKNISSNLLSEINDLKNKSRPNYKAGLDKNNFIYTISPHKYDTDIDDVNFEDKFAGEFKSKLNFDTKDDVHSKYRKVKKSNHFKKHKSLVALHKNGCKDFFRHEKGRSRTLDLKHENLGDEIVKNPAMRSQCHHVLIELPKKSTFKDIDKLSLDVNNLKVDEKCYVDNICVSKHDKEIKKQSEYLENEIVRPFEEHNQRFIEDNLAVNPISSKKYCCYQCYNIYRKQNLIETCTQRGHSNVFECAVCKKSYSNRHEIVQHLQRHLNYGSTSEDSEKKLSEQCGNEYDQSHLKKQCIERKFNCNYCEISFETKELLLIHMEKNHKLVGDIVNIISCSFCESFFCNDHDLAANYSSKRNYPCPVFPMEFNALREKHKHVQQVHDKVAAVKKQQCPFCDKTFPKIKTLNKHLFAHTGKKHYKCDHCPLAFVKRKHLNIHKRNEHNIDRSTGSLLLDDNVKRTKKATTCRSPAPIRASHYKCDICHSAYESSKTLKRHKHLHHNVTRLMSGLSLEGNITAMKEATPCPASTRPLSLLDFCKLYFLKCKRRHSRPKGSLLSRSGCRRSS